MNLCIMSHMGKHLSVLHDRIPVFYSLKYPKFTADLYQFTTNLYQNFSSREDVHVHSPSSYLWTKY